MSSARSLLLPRRPLGLLGALGAAGTLFGATRSAQAQSIDDILNKKKLQAGTVQDMPPFSVVNASNQCEGYDVDVATLMAKYLGVDLELVPLTAPNRIPFLLTGKVDMLIASLSITPERARQVAFSIPYATIEINVLAPKETRITGAADLKGLKVGVSRATIQDAAVTAIAPAGTRIMRFDDDASAVQAMLSGQVDALGANNLIALRIGEMNPSAHYEVKMVLRGSSRCGISVRRGQTDLLQWVNTFVYFIKNNGELDTISHKWFGTPLPELPVF
jgi:polar amino acid transport system substrate-binding protein